MHANCKRNKGFGAYTIDPLEVDCIIVTAEAGGGEGWCVYNSPPPGKGIEKTNVADGMDVHRRRKRYKNSTDHTSKYTRCERLHEGGLESFHRIASACTSNKNLGEYVCSRKRGYAET